MKRSKILKYITFLIIFTITITLNFSINISQYGTSSSPNKHFLQMGIGEVEAASTRVEHIKLSNVRIYNKSQLEDYNDTYTIKITQSIEFNIDDYIDRKPDTNVRATGYISWNAATVTGSSAPNDEYLRLDVLNATLNGWDNNLTYNSGKRSFNNTLYPYELKVKIYFTKERYGYYSPRTWTAETYVDVDLTVEYTPNNSTPSITITTPTPNSPLLGRQAFTKGVV